ncbi:MAG: FliH/SctL family protein [Desulfocucumaceae bacterium]
MQSCYKIIKGLDKTVDCTLLELRQVLINGKAIGDRANSQGEGEDAPEAVPAVDYNQLAEIIIREAEEKAKKILTEGQKAVLEMGQKAQLKAEEEYERVKQLAAADGYDEGRKEALAKAAADASAIRDQARSVLRQAEEIRRLTLDSLESEVVRLSIEISEKLISTKLNLDPEIVVQVAKEAISMLHKRDKVFLYVHPSEEDLFEEWRGDLIKCLTPKGELHIITDSDIGPGGCIAETENGRVDARLDNRWEVLLEALGEISK